MYKETLPKRLTKRWLGIFVGLTGSDASIYQTTHKDATSLKLEFTYKYKDFIVHLHQLLDKWTVSEEPKLYEKKVKEEGSDVVKIVPHSYYFYVMSHPALNILWRLFMKKREKKAKKFIRLVQFRST